MWEELDKEAQVEPVLAAVAKVFLCTPTDKRNFAAIRENNALYPLTYLIPRPLIVQHTYSAYFIQSGGQTLITRMGQPLVHTFFATLFVADHATDFLVERIAAPGLLADADLQGQVRLHQQAQHLCGSQHIHNTSSSTP